jgi:hypothetical protein
MVRLFMELQALRRIQPVITRDVDPAHDLSKYGI